MKRRAILQSLVSVPTAVVLSPDSAAQKVQRPPAEESRPVREKGVPAGPPVVAPGANEMPTTPVTGADAVAQLMVRTFNRTQFETLSKFSELMAPSTEDVPGAREADAAAFLDFLIGASPPDIIDLYKGGLDQLDNEARRKYHKPFAQINNDEADALLSVLNQPWQFEGPRELLPRFLLRARADTIKATLNSRSYLDAISQTRRTRHGSGFYWLPID
jgi:Gluconate 2-dehydrogenase subunit 3